MSQRKTAALSIAVAAAFALPASQAQQKQPEQKVLPPKAQVWIDVSTHNMAGMPDMGALGGIAGMMMGGDKGNLRYPTARNAAGMTGQYLDIAFLSQIKSGVEVQDAIPAGLKLGKSLPLVPPVVENSSSSGTSSGQIPDIEYTIHEYWGCGDKVRSGQPKSFTVKIKSGAIQASGGLSRNIFVPDRDVDETPAYAVWPNKKNGKHVPNGASLAGTHQFSGTGVPESLKFELGQNADFMPKIALTSSGELKDAIAVSWQPVDRAKAYFLSALAMKGQNEMVLWSSAEVGGAGQELLNFLSGSYVDKWVKQKVLLPTSTTSCTVPTGIFAGTSAPGAQGAQGGMNFAMLNMVAYGPETHIAYPPRPADPAITWEPDYNVRVRTKSTAGAMLGLNLGGAFPTAEAGADESAAADGADAGSDETAGEEPKKKKGLKGLLDKVKDKVK